MSTYTPDQVLDALLQLQLDEAALRARISRELGIASIDALALQHLARAERHAHYLRVGDLRPLLGVSRAAATTIVNRLQVAGYATKSTTADGDRRARSIILTTTAHNRLAQTLDPARTGIDTVLAAMDDLETARTLRVLQELSEAISPTR